MDIKFEHNINESEEQKNSEIIHVNLPIEGIHNTTRFIYDTEEDNENQDNILFEMPESIQTKHTITTKLDNTLKDMVFLVQPLLAVRIFNNQERISISIEEIQRRVSPPESLSQPLLLALLRMNKERSNQLTAALSQFGINNLSEKAAVVSSFSKLSEAEAKTIAEDYYFLASRYMNINNMNQLLVTSNGGVQQFSRKANRTKEVLQLILTEIEKRDNNLSNGDRCSNRLLLYFESGLKVILNIGNNLMLIPRK